MAQVKFDPVTHKLQIYKHILATSCYIGRENKQAFDYMKAHVAKQFMARMRSFYPKPYVKY